ncbi:hypothetical protein [Streptomyces sp. NK15101]|uniref:hypothetical protein n=1 Tax=Streptomyces sp. NK15101 TaxID=2873261 RepID=UPI001CECFCC0|nr:hypothetical protein [Streptomyces sp. NK15101]
MVNTFAVRGAPVPSHDGTVFDPDPLPCAVDDGWRRHDHRVIGRGAAAAAGLAALAIAAKVLGRRR